MTIEAGSFSAQQLPEAAGINTVEELTKRTEQDIMKVRNLGKNPSRKSRAGGPGAVVASGGRIG